MGINLSNIQTSKKEVAQGNSSAKSTGWLNKDIQLFGNGFSDKKKEAFYLELSILLSAGMDIKSILEMLTSEQVKEKDKMLYQDICNRVVEGASLSEAVKAQEVFSAYEYYSIQIGEETGKLNKVLAELADYYNKRIKQRRQIIGALTYPGIVLFTSFLAIFFMLNFIVPMFADIFKRFGGNLPPLTSAIMSVSDFIRSYFLLLLFFIIAFVVFIYTQKNKAWYRKNSTVLLLKLPLFGEMIRKIYLARFCNSMTLLISSKVNLLRAIGLVKQMIDFYPIEESLLIVEKDILKGESLHKSLSQFPIYHSRMISLVKVGEEANQLELFFEKIAKQYNDDIEHQSSIISSLLEPFMIIFLGLIVGVILIAMYLPLFQLSSSF
ncbi:MAG: type secretory pathway, component PulF [Chitinophagaceae bacterium]|nr:type secretory pathway, component PulF [Chitinophagaceae bacterium]